MGKVLLFVLLLIVLTVIFKIVAEWFQYNKNINILPATFIEMIAVIVFLYTFGSTNTSEAIWMWLSVATVTIISILNLVRYGIRDGILTSLAELVFSVSAVFLIVCILIAGGQKKSNRRK